MLLRRPSAICHSLASKPRLAPVSAFDSVFLLGSIGRASPPQIQAEIHLHYCAAEYPFPHEKSLRPFGEVLSYEFWVLSYLAQCSGVGEGLRGSGWSIWFVWLVGGTEAKDGLSGESGLFAL